MEIAFDSKFALSRGKTYSNARVIQQGLQRPVPGERPVVPIAGMGLLSNPFAPKKKKKKPKKKK